MRCDNSHHGNAALINNSEQHNNPWGDFQKKVKVKDFAGMIKERKLNYTPHFPNEKKYYYMAAIFIFIMWLLSGFYQINEGEESVVVRFGKYIRTDTTGLNYHLPYPFENVIVEKVGLIRKEEIGNGKTYEKNSIIKRKNSMGSSDNQVLTGDENILDISYVVQWKINNLYDFIFNVYEPRSTIRDVVESALREIVGKNTLAKTYTDGRYDVEHEAKNVAQQTLDKYKIGIELVAIQMMKVDPPAEVIDSFREVQNAKADKEREINLAQSYRNDVIPKARGQAAKIVHEGLAYKEEVVSRSEGDASRFKMMYDEYSKAKFVTKKRMYLDTMQNILNGTEAIILGNSKGNISYLPLPELSKKKE